MGIKGDISDVWEVIEWWELPEEFTGRGYKCPKKVLVGWGRKPIDRFEINLPRPPSDPRLIRNFYEERFNRVWSRTPDHPEWDDEYLIEMANTKHSKMGKVESKWWWRTHASDSMVDYAEWHWKRRKDGEWIVIDSTVTWLPGMFWCFRHWVKVDGELAMYSGLQLLVSYILHWDTTEGNGYGIIWLKRRRLGGTILIFWEGLNHTMLHQNANMGLMGNSKDEVEEDFQEKMVPMWRNLPAFFRVENSGTSDPKTGFKFKAEARGGSAKFTGAKGNQSNVYIAARSNSKQTFDRLKLTRFVFDEFAKLSYNPYKAWREIKRTFERMGRIIGRARMVSTAEEIHSSNILAASDMVYDSVPSRGHDGRTGTGMRLMFFPAWAWLWIEDIIFIGRFGEPVIEDPTPEQLEWLCKEYPHNAHRYRMGGAKAWMEREMAALESANREAFRRQYPNTPEEAFRGDASSALIDAEKVANIREALDEEVSAGVRLWQQLTIRCRIETVRPVRSVLNNQQTMIDMLHHPDGMQMIPDPDGDWIVRRDFFDSCGKDWHPNRVLSKRRIDGMHMEPAPNHSLCFLGVDPIDSDKDHVKEKHLSDMAICAFRMFDPRLDNSSNDGSASGIRSYSPVMMYAKRPRSATEAFVELAKCMVLLGSKAHIEAQKGSALMRELKTYGMGSMIASRPITTFTQARITKGLTASDFSQGTHASDDLYDLSIQPIVNEWVLQYATPHNCPFPRFWDECRDLDRSDMRRFDVFVAFMFSILAAWGGAVAEPRKNKYIAQGKAPAKTVRLGHDPYKFAL